MFSDARSKPGQELKAKEIKCLNATTSFGDIFYRHTGLSDSVYMCRHNDNDIKFLSHSVSQILGNLVFQYYQHLISNSGIVDYNLLKFHME